MNKTSTKARLTFLQKMLLIKIKRQDLLHDGKTFLIQLLNLRGYIYDLLNIPKCISVSTYRLIASACKIKCFSV